MSSRHACTVFASQRISDGKGGVTPKLIDSLRVTPGFIFSARPVLSLVRFVVVPVPEKVELSGTIMDKHMEAVRARIV
jgi:hypothetical protein